MLGPIGAQLTVAPFCSATCSFSLSLLNVKHKGAHHTLVATEDGTEILPACVTACRFFFLIFSARHLLILPSDFRIARGTEQAVVTALKTPTEAPRVLIVPQWCVDPLHERGSGELPSLELEDLRRQAADGTAELCFSHAGTNRDLYLGGSVLEAAVYGEGAGEGLGDPGARHSGEDGKRTTKNGLALLLSDAVSPAIVVDMWSAPALFLRHIEVRGTYEHWRTAGVCFAT